jgi:4-amino-4-deoxy-L-arabinose transferase-like glycosyltransferase
VRRLFAVGLIALCLAAVTAQTLGLGALRLQPRYDEVHYIAVARDYQRLGGVAGAVACHLEGRCLEDNRPPLYEFLLTLFAHDAPSFYAEAKLITLATTFLLFAIIFAITWRRFSPRHAVASVVILALLPTLGEVSSGVLGDPLFAAAIFAAVAAIGSCQARGALAWLGTGALIGLAYLTKGNGHLLFLALLGVAAALDRRRLVRSGRPYVALCGFVAVSSFLLWRNVRVFGSPFHNFNDRPLWLDGWEDVWRLMRTPEWARIGPAYYLHHHSVFALGWRIVRGLGQTFGVLLYSFGLGIRAGTPIQLLPTTAAVIARVATGAGMAALAAAGLVARWRAGRRAEVLAALHGCGWLVLAFAVGGQGVGGVATRFMLPIVGVLVPYAAHGFLDGLLPWLSARAPRWAIARAAVVVASAALVIKLFWFAPALARDPRLAYDVPSRWAETSAWFATHLEPGERYAFPFGSVYSTWDRPRPDPDARWVYTFRVPAAEMEHVLAEGVPATIEPRREGPPRPVTKIFVDREDKGFASFEDKLSATTDAHGPLGFLGWSRCFADGDRPSRFLVFCR